MSQTSCGSLSIQLVLSTSSRRLLFASNFRCTCLISRLSGRSCSLSCASSLRFWSSSSRCFSESSPSSARTSRPSFSTPCSASLPSSAAFGLPRVRKRKPGQVREVEGPCSLALLHATRRPRRSVSVPGRGPRDPKAIPWQDVQVQGRQEPQDNIRVQL